MYGFLFTESFCPLLEVDLWSNDPNQFVEDEDEETLSYSVRISAQFLILVSSTTLSWLIEYFLDIR